MICADGTGARGEKRDGRRMTAGLGGNKEEIYPPQPMLIIMACAGQTSKQVPQLMQ